jgi:hypothetical protein
MISDPDIIRTPKLVIDQCGEEAATLCCRRLLDEQFMASVLLGVVIDARVRAVAARAVGTATWS